jgi:hypothetical protein
LSFFVARFSQPRAQTSRIFSRKISRRDDAPAVGQLQVTCLAFQTPEFTRNCKVEKDANQAPSTTPRTPVGWPLVAQALLPVSF